MAKSPNRLLASLSPEILAALRPHLKTVELKFGDVVAETGGPVQQVYFPYSGVISLVVEMDVGMMIETAMVGNDGAANAASALDGKVALNKGIVQVAGSAGVIEVNQLRQLANELEPLRGLLIRHEQVLFAQAQQSAGCNASHSIEARMCRWLLYMRDLAGGGPVAADAGFSRPDAGGHAAKRVDRGQYAATSLIKYSRGRIQILNVPGLQEGTCECYATVKAHYDQMLSDHHYI
jgi:hypothetical protein